MRTLLVLSLLVFFDQGLHTVLKLFVLRFQVLDLKQLVLGISLGLLDRRIGAEFVLLELSLKVGGPSALILQIGVLRFELVVHVAEILLSSLIVFLETTRLQKKLALLVLQLDLLDLDLMFAASDRKSVV